MHAPSITRSLSRPDNGRVTEDEEALREVERRVLWLATSIVHAANARRPNDSGVKVGGHQASSASMVSIMTALWFDALTPADRVSVKPHASPVLHAISFLLGRLDASYLPRLRELGGLQPYPSRTKDPDVPDYSTGSVGIGATAPVWGALAQRYVSAHFDVAAGGRQISLVGDAELDEGAIWECVNDPMVQRLGEVLWVVDLNRQSLDRIVPDIQVAKWAGLFRAAGWQVLEVKYGRLLQSLFARDGGERLRDRIDEMGNEEFQWLLRSPAAELRTRLDVGAVLAGLSDDDIAAALRDLGGHDLVELRRTFREVDNDRPTVVFAYTIKGRGLPVEGHPANHSALLNEEQYAALAQALGQDGDDPWQAFDADSPAGRLCRDTAARLERPALPEAKPPDIPLELGRTYRGVHSTQATLGRVLTDLARDAPDVAARIVTVSPDVASSTNTGGWINKVGVWSPQDRHDWFAEDGDRLVRWRETSTGQHIELGIAEVNLVGLLGELGAIWSRVGQPLLPIGTVYDPFVARALEPWVFGTYAGGQSILVGTPSGVTLAPEGGAHQSITTPSIGLETPGTTCYEPAFAVETEWCLLDALSRLGRHDGESAYLRLTTRPIDQSLAALPDDAAGRAQRRKDVLAGAYRLRTAEPEPAVTIAVVGALVPEAVAAADELARLGVAADVVVVTSYDRLWRALQSRRGLLTGSTYGIDESVFERVFRASPLVTVLDGHPHTLAFLGTVNATAVSCLGVSMFGQGGGLQDVYRLHGLDTASIVGAALDLVDESLPE
ncbi:MAG: pyruvate dehydrogenase [Frankiaceae bacterium]|nr:pyruvate dehydrogenase [Frankiaceae bacterium]